MSQVIASLARAAGLCELTPAFNKFKEYCMKDLDQQELINRSNEEPLKVVGWDRNNSPLPFGFTTNRAHRRAAIAQKISRKHLRKRPNLLQRKLTQRCGTIQVGQMKTLGFLKRAVPDLDAGPAGQLALASR